MTDEWIKYIASYCEHIFTKNKGMEDQPDKHALCPMYRRNMNKILHREIRFFKRLHNELPAAAPPDLV